MITLLKKTDRILLEMHTGMVLFGIVCQGIGFFFVSDRFMYSKSLWFGILFAAIAAIHMAKTMDRALSDVDRTAKIISTGYVVRYIMLIIIMAVTALTKVLFFPMVFLGYMSLKVTAYLQPFTHKFYNFLFHETDPVPEVYNPEEEESMSDGEFSSKTDS